MAKVKTATLIDAALDWAVCMANGVTEAVDLDKTYVGASGRKYLSTKYGFTIDHIGDPKQFWPLLKREMSVKCGRLQIKNETWATDKSDCFSAEYTGSNWEQHKKHYGPTPEVAALRCHVASKLSETLDVPDVLLQLVEVAGQVETHEQDERAVSDLPKETNG
jgi:hypothetical protein